MMTLPQRAATHLRATGPDEGLVSEDALLSNLQRLRWLVLGVLPVNAMCVAAFWLGDRGVTARQMAWKQTSGWIHLCMGLWLLAVLLAASWCRRRRTTGPDVFTRLTELAGALACLVFPALLVSVDQWVTPNITPFLIGSVFLSLLVLMRPSVSIPVYALGFGVLYLGLGLTQADPMQLLANRLSGGAAAVMGVVLSWLLWHKNTGYAMLQRELRARNAVLQQQQEELVWLAKRDPLTELFNRGEFLRVAELELKRALRHHTDTSAIMVDLDHFKRINDAHGHPAGDSVLRHTAAQLLRGVRETDVVARIGGEEFMVLLPQTSLDAAHRLAEKLLRALQASPAPLDRALSIPVTASFGVATLPAGQGATVAWLYACADHALYAAKRLGRNRVERTQPDGSQTASDFQRMRRQ